MPTATAPAPPVSVYLTLADVLKRVGKVHPSRIRMVPAPGTATELDVTDLHDRESRRFELIDGILVEKFMGFEESGLAIILAAHLLTFVRQHNLGRILGADAAMRLFPGRIRYPDVAFISWDRYPKGKRKRGEIPDVAPDLVVEVLSKGNTRAEMARKLEDYSRSGVRLVWYVDSKKRTVQVFTAADQSVTLGDDDTVDGGDVLPGFALAIRDWFDEGEQQGP